MIEARSCERFKILSEEIDDADLRQFYRELMESEARHYTTFLGFARKYGQGVDVDRAWKDFWLLRLNSWPVIVKRNDARLGASFLFGGGLVFKTRVKFRHSHHAPSELLLR